jgi:hypothetical protein
MTGSGESLKAAVVPMFLISVLIFPFPSELTEIFVEISIILQTFKPIPDCAELYMRKAKAEKMDHEQKSKAEGNFASVASR